MVWLLFRRLIQNSYSNSCSSQARGQTRSTGTKNSWRRDVQTRKQIRAFIKQHSYLAPGVAGPAVHGSPCCDKVSPLPLFSAGDCRAWSCLDLPCCLHSQSPLLQGRSWKPNHNGERFNDWTSALPSTDKRCYGRNLPILLVLVRIRTVAENQKPHEFFSRTFHWFQGDLSGGAQSPAPDNTCMIN